MMEFETTHPSLIARLAHNLCGEVYSLATPFLDDLTVFVSLSESEALALE